jgi:hypothetical protein
MKYLSALMCVLVVLFMVGCGGGGSGHNGGGGAGSGGGSAPIDPSGNWEMVVSDGNNTAHFASMFNQVGSVVTSNSFTATGNAAPFNCVPFSAGLSNGNVTGATFTGNVTMHYDVNFPSDLTPTQSTWAFTSTVASDEKSFSGTYSSLAACTGVGATGSFTGTAIPTTSGSWTGTITPCSYNSQTGVCTDSAPGSGYSASLTQDDSTGNVTGTYNVAALVGLQTGTVAVNTPDQDILSGRTWQFTMTESGGGKFIVNGHLDLAGGFSGLVLGVSGVDSGNHYNLVMSH